MTESYLSCLGASITHRERDYLKAAAAQVADTRLCPLIVNIGCWHGATLACLRAGAPLARLIGVDIDFETPELLFSDFERLHGDSREVHAQVSGDIDLLFIDGDHHYEVIREDITNWLPKVRPDGLVIFHDYEPASMDMVATPHLEGVRRAVDEWSGAAGDGWMAIMGAPDSLRTYRRASQTNNGRLNMNEEYNPGVPDEAEAKRVEEAFRKITESYHPIRSDEEQTAVDAVQKETVAAEVVEEAPKPKPRRRRKKATTPHPMAGMVVRGKGRAYWQVDSQGRRRLIPTIQHFYKIGLQKVHRLSEEQLDKLPEGWPLR